MDHFDNRAGNHLFNFYGPDEIGTVAAVFADHIETLELKGNDSSVDAYHRGVAAWDEEADLKGYQTDRPKNFLCILQEYKDHTEEVVSGILYSEDDRETRIAAMAQRYRFGYHSGVLVQAVQEALEASSVPSAEDE